MYKQHESLNKKRVVETTFNPETMLQDTRIEEELESPSGEGELKIWVIKDKTKVIVFFKFLTSHNVCSFQISFALVSSEITNSTWS
jgi:hypothetical protein